VDIERKLYKVINIGNLAGVTKGILGYVVKAL